MFDINGTTITMTAGDTGSFKMHLSGYEFGENDYVIFTVKTGNGSVMIEREYQPDENGDILVSFFNSETYNYAAATYSWDIRIVLNAYRDDDGNITNGDQIITPHTPMNFILERAVGTISSEQRTHTGTLIYDDTETLQDGTVRYNYHTTANPVHTSGSKTIYW